MITDLSSMSCLLMAIPVLSPISRAHFTVLHPPSIYTFPGGVIPSIPKCGYSPYPITSSITGPIPLVSLYSTQIAVTTHGSAAWRIRLVFDPIRPYPGSGTQNFYDIYPKLTTKGNGTFCIDTVNAPGLTARNMREFSTRPVDGLGDSKAAWISVRGTIGDGRFYQCALVTYSENAPEQPVPEACRNSTGVEVRYASDQIEQSESSDSSPDAQGGTTSILDEPVTAIVLSSTSRSGFEVRTTGESTDASPNATVTGMELASNEASTKVVPSTQVITNTATSVPVSSGTMRQATNSRSTLWAAVGVCAVTIGILVG